MRILYLVRHAKSSWEHPELSDFERPLNKRGKRDAPFLSNRLKEKGVKPELMISSPAVRARETSVVIAKTIDYPINNIIVDDNIYEASSTKLINIVRSFDDKYNSVMMIGHNPSFTMLNNYLTDNYITNIPTTGVVGISINSSWKNTKSSSGKVFFFIYPKLFNERKNNIGNNKI